MIAKIIERATSDDVRVVTLLRQCLVLADSLDNKTLKEWASAELNGYPDHEAVPLYRITPITAKGLFLGPMGAQLNDQPLPAAILDARHQNWATTAFLSEPIAAYERLASDPKKDGCALVNWPADLTAMYQTKFFKGYALNRAWQEIPIGAIASMVDTVQTRILQLALELQREGGGEANDATPEPIKVEQAVQTIIYSGTNIINSSFGDHAQFGGLRFVVEGDFDSLEKRLKDIGLTDEKIRALKTAVADDEAEGAPKGFGARVGGWLQKAAKSVGQEGGKAASGAASEVVTKAVLSYFGIGG